MNILQIAPKIPYPLYDGGAIGIFNITKYLALRGNNITFITFSYDDKTDYQELQKYCRVLTVKKNNKNSKIGAFLSFFSKVPYTHKKYFCSEIFDLIDEELKNNSYDIVHIDHLHMSIYGKYIKKKYKLPVVLREHNYETLIWERLYKNEKNFFKKMFFKNQYSKINVYEPEECKFFDKCLMVTKDDLNKLLSRNQNINTEVVPAGVDIDYFSNFDNAIIQKKTILFIGSLEWFPNLDAFKWFYKKIFPLVLKKVPDVKLYVIGKNPPEEIRNIKDPNVEIYGMVEDIRPFVSKANVCVVPLRIGGGIRIKIIELLSMKKAIVTTSIGIEGIDVIDGEHLIVKDSENDFADTIIKLFNDDDLVYKLGYNGFNLIKNKYGWNIIAEQIENIYKKLIN